MESVVASLTANLTDDEFEEYQKVFSIICSNKIIDNDEMNNIQYLNQNNVFTCNNITAFVQKITHNYNITKQNVVSVMPLLDIKYSGIISWEAFIAALNDWINRCQCFEGLYRRKVGLVLGSRERQILHYAIANFFLLAAKGVPNTISKLDSILELVGSKFDFQLIDFMEEAKNEKLSLNREPAELLKNFDVAIQEIGQAATFYQGLQIFNDILRFISRIKSPLDLLANAELVLKLFGYIFSVGLFGQLCNLIVTDENLHTRWEALKTLSYILACMKVKNETFDGSQYLQNDEVKFYLGSEEFLYLLLNLTYSQCLEVQEQSRVCVGYIIQLSEIGRNYFVSMNIVTNYHGSLVDGSSDIQLEMISFVLASFATSLPLNVNYMDTNLLFALVECGFKLLNLRDLPCLLRDGFEILAVTLPLVNAITSENKIIFERIVKLLELHPNVAIKRFALATMKEMIEKNDNQTKVLLEYKLLQTLNEILISNEHTLKLLCCRIIHLLAKKGYCLQILEAKTLPIISKRLYDTANCRWECVKILKNIVSVSASYASLLVEDGLIKLIFNTLTYFKEQDDVLAACYNFQGSYLNLPYLIDCLHLLNSVIQSGYGTKGLNNLNMFVDYFEYECVDRLRQVTEALFEDKTQLKSQINRSYIKSYTQDGFEALFVKFVEGLRTIHKNRESETSKALLYQISNLLMTINSTFIEINSTSNPGSPSKSTSIAMEVKCLSAENYPYGDNRVLTIARNSSLVQLKNAIELKYDYYGPLLLKYIDRNQDLLTIDTDEVLQKVINEATENLLNYSLTAPSITMLRIVVQFASPNPNLADQPKEAHCIECGKNFEVLEAYGPIDPNWTCATCEYEKTQIEWIPPQNMSMGYSGGYPRTPFPSGFR